MKVSDFKVGEVHKGHLVSEIVDGHVWGIYTNQISHQADTYESCRICGFIRRADKKNKPCKGQPKLRL